MLTSSWRPFYSNWYCIISHTSLTTSLLSNLLIFRENLLFSILLMSRQSSTTLSRWRAEVSTIRSDYSVFPGRLRTDWSIIMIIRNIGIIEFRGVRSSWATDEKKVFLTFCISFYVSLILVMSVHIAIIFSPLSMTDVLTCIYRFGFLVLKTVSILAMFFYYLCFPMMCSHIFALIGALSG